MHKQSTGVHKTVVVLLGVVGFIIGIFLLQHMDIKHKVDSSQFHGIYLDEPKTLHDFSLIDINNKPFDKSFLQGHWTIVFFGFTNCPSICPTTMAKLSKMYRMLDQKGIKKLPQIVLISVDPERDTLGKLEQYVHAFHQSFDAARGSEQQIQDLAKELGVVYAKVQSSDHPQSYDIQHGGAILLFNPQAELNAILTPPHHVDVLVKEYLMVVS